MHNRIFDKFVQHQEEATSNLRAGSGHETKTTYGPLISVVAVVKVARLVDDAISHGVKMILKGKRRQDIGTIIAQILIPAQHQTELVVINFKSLFLRANHFDRSGS